ncbi:MAG: T9SS type A sorting domain-containing protein [bacterium]
MKNLIIYLTACVLLCMDTVHAKEQQLLSGGFGFIENKGQIKYPDGQRADEILYMFASQGMKIYIKKNSISYELYSCADTRRQTADRHLTKDNNRNFMLRQTDDELREPSIINSHRVDIEFVSANSSPTVIAEDRCYEYYNFFNNNDEIKNVSIYRKIRIKDIYPGIDVIYYFAGDDRRSNQNSKENHVLKDKGFSGYKFKYDLVVAPGVDLEKIRLIYKGADNIILSDEGNLNIKTSEGEVAESIPLAYYFNEELGSRNEEPSNVWELVKCSYAIVNNLEEDEKKFLKDNERETLGNRQTTGKYFEIGFNIENRNKSKTLVIDPELFWGTYFGGNRYDYFTNVTLDSRDNIYAIGYTESSSQIATSGAYQTSYAGNWDAVLAKFNNQGRMVWATYYGGSQQDFGYSVVVNKEDKPYISGNTSSTSGMSTAGAYQETYGGGVFDGFIAKFNTNGAREWGTYFGSSEVDVINSMALDSNKNLIIGGRTQSFTGIASGNGFQNYKEGLIDGFVVKFDSTMNRVWGTYFGGNDETGSEAVTGVAADRAGNVIFTGYTPCDYSITNDKGFQPDYGGGSYDAYIIKLYPSGSMHWGSYYGGSDDDFGRAVATYGNGNIYLVGTTRSYNNISSTGGHQQTFGGFRDAFIVKFDTYGERKWGTYYGGSNDDLGISVSKYGFDEVVVLGYTNSSSNIATSGEVQTSLRGLEDAFAVRFNTNGMRKWGTYYGGLQTETFEYGGISYDKKGNVIIAGTSQSSDGISTPETNPYQPDWVGDFTFSIDEKTGDTIFTYKNDAFLIMLGTRITINNFATSYCQSSTISVPFTVGLDFETDNIFTLQLSDETGDFTNPVTLGTLAGYSSGWIQGTIPKDTEPGSAYRLRITASSPSNISENNGTDITINPLPVPEITGETPICSRNTYTYQSSSGAGYEFVWKVSNGTIIGDSTSSVINVKWIDKPQGKLKMIQTASATGCVDSTEKNIDIIISPEPFITGETSVSSYSIENYSTMSNSILDYEWTIIGGSILGLTNTNRIDVSWAGPGIGSILLKMTDTKTQCFDTVMINITINSSPLKIMGKKKVCAFSNESYSVVTPNTCKNLWSLTGGQIIGSNQDSLLNVLWSDAAEGFVQLIQTDTVSGAMDTVVQRIEIIPAPIVNFYGIDEFCEGANATYIAENTQDRSNKWIIYNGEIIGSDTKDTVLVIWNSINPDEDSVFVKGSISLVQTDLTTGCSNTRVKSTSISKSPSAEFWGNVQVCSGRVETYSVKDRNTFSNKWTVTGGTIIGIAEDTTLQVEWGQPGTGKIKLFQVAATTCFDSSETEIIIKPVPEKPNITPSGKDLISSSETGNQWFFNGEKIDGAVDKIFTPGKTGYYTLIVTNQEDCESDMSQPYYFEISKVIDRTLSELGIHVYPNPTDNVLNIDFNYLNFYNIRIRIFNALGVTYFNCDTAMDRNIKIDLNNYPAGMYILEMQLGPKIYFEKIVRQ